MNISKRVFGFLLAVLMALSFAVCTSAGEADRTFADLVV